VLYKQFAKLVQGGRRTKRIGLFFHEGKENEEIFSI
jgi:hypothetical protein